MSGLAQSNEQPERNPFTLPSDEEVFKMVSHSAQRTHTENSVSNGGQTGDDSEGQAGQRPGAWSCWTLFPFAVLNRALLLSRKEEDTERTETCRTRQKWPRSLARNGAAHNETTRVCRRSRRRTARRVTLCLYGRNDRACLCGTLSLSLSLCSTKLFANPHLFLSNLSLLSLCLSLSRSPASAVSSSSRPVLSIVTCVLSPPPPPHPAFFPFPFHSPTFFCVLTSSLASSTTTLQREADRLRRSAPRVGLSGPSRPPVGGPGGLSSSR